MGDSTRAPQTRFHFPDTRWSMVVAATTDDSQARQALEDLCRGYWPPIYAELRKRGHPPSDAQDLTQEFFARLLRRQTFASANRELGRFRSYLLGALDHFLVDVTRGKTALKRGGGEAVLSLDAEECEAWFREQPSTSGDAASAFDQRWALVLLDRALEALREEYRASGRAGIFDALQPFLAAEAGGEGYDEACRKVEMTAAAFTVAVHRLRKRFKQAVREQVAMTVSDAADVEAEMKHLFGNSR